MIRAFAAAALLLAVGAGAADRNATRGEAELAKALAGRTIARTADCITPIGSQSLQVVDNHTILYSETAKRIWRSDLLNSCTGLDPDDIIVIDRVSGSQWCRGDGFHSVDRTTLGPSGACRFGSFVAYDKP